MSDTKSKLAQLRIDVEAGHEHPGVSLLRLIDLMLGRMVESEPEPGQAPAPVIPVPVAAVATAVNTEGAVQDNGDGSAAAN